MTKEELRKEHEKFEDYKKALKAVYADGSVSSAERAMLLGLKNELGLSDSDCRNMESVYRMISENAENKRKTTFEDLCECHHCRCFDGSGRLKTESIGYQALECAEIGGTYLELTTAGYTGLGEPLAVSVGQTFEELLDEYGERHIYDAVSDGRLQVFDSSCSHTDMLDWIKMKFNMLSAEDMEREYSDAVKLEPVSAKEPVEIVKEVAGRKERAEAPDLFRNEFRSRMQDRSVSKDPFIVTKSIINEWKETKPECIPVLNEWLKERGCTSKEGFDSFFRTLTGAEHKKAVCREKFCMHERQL